MGNLGRPGYGATADGLWPYTSVVGLPLHILFTRSSHLRRCFRYDSCDWGTLPNVSAEPAWIVILRPKTVTLILV